MLRIGLVCFLGAFIGALVAAEIGGTFWWVGAIAGALVAYLGYEIKPLALAARKATASTVVALASVKDWRLPSKEWWWKLWLSWSGMMLLMLFCASWFFLPICAIAPSSILGKWSSLWGTGAGLVFFAFVFTPCVMANSSSSSRAESLRQDTKKLLIRGNPLAVAFLVLKVCFYLLRALPWLVIFWTVVFFRLIHSEARLVCALDAALGAAVGYFAGNALIGGLVGGILGIGHFWLARRRRWGLAA